MGLETRPWYYQIRILRQSLIKRDACKAQKCDFCALPIVPQPHLTPPSAHTHPPPRPRPNPSHHSTAWTYGTLTAEGYGHVGALDKRLSEWLIALHGTLAIDTGTQINEMGAMSLTRVSLSMTWVSCRRTGSFNGQHQTVNPTIYLKIAPLL